MKMHVAYLAGIIDGEGSIMLPRTGVAKLNGLYTAFSVKVAIANTNLALLEELQRHFGGVIEVATTPKHIDTTNYKVGYRLRWFGAEAVRVINLCRAHLFVKAIQADIVCAVFNEQQRHGRRQRTPQQVSFFNDAALHIKELNRRGAIA